MKIISQISYLIFTILSLVSCNTEVAIDPNADLATKVAGDYNVSELKVDKVAYELVKQGIVAKINITKKDNANAVMSLSTTVNRQTYTDDLGTMELKDTGKSGINLYQNTAQVGNINGSTLTLDITDSGTNYVLKAGK